jgi:hypothetical protein
VGGVPQHHGQGRDAAQRVERGNPLDAKLLRQINIPLDLKSRVELLPPEGENEGRRLESCLAGLASRMNGMTGLGTTGQAAWLLVR